MKRGPDPNQTMYGSKEGSYNLEEFVTEMGFLVRHQSSPSEVKPIKNFELDKTHELQNHQKAQEDAALT